MAYRAATDLAQNPLNLRLDLWEPIDRAGRGTTFPEQRERYAKRLSAGGGPIRVAYLSYSGFSEFKSTWIDRGTVFGINQIEPRATGREFQGWSSDLSCRSAFSGSLFLIRGT